MAVRKSPYGPTPSKVSTYRPDPPKPAPVARPQPQVYKPTNPGWGNAATAAKLKALNPSGVTPTFGWTPQQGASFWGQSHPWEDYTPPSIDMGGPLGGGPGGSSGGDGGAYWGHALSSLEAQRDEALGAARIGAGGRIKQALIDLGLSDVSGLSGDIQGYIDAPTLAAAKANKYSSFALAEQAARKATAKSRAQLAARGMLSSGQLTKEATDIVEMGEKARYAATRDFSGQAQGVLEQLATSQRDWAGRIAEARMQAAAAGWGGGGGGGGGASSQYLGGNTGDQGAGLVGRPGEYAGGATVIEGYNPNRNSDARYDMSGAQQVPGGYILNGVFFDESGRVR